jgi:phosphatidylglycerophosphate synthase
MTMSKNEDGTLKRNRRVYEQVGQTLGKVGAAIGLAPDFWTLSALALSFVAAFFVARRQLAWALVIMALMALVDMMDGSTARAQNLVTPFGGVLDHVLDRYAELIIAAGFILNGLVPPFWVYFAMAGALMASYVRGKAESMTDIESCNVGLVGRLEKALILFAGIIVYWLDIGTGALTWAFILVGVLSHITAGQRLLYTRRMTRSGGEQMP